ncbi:MAG: hypothetical protein JRG92_01950 [Deltaproteobacteria bacterium]|nr:hypothetical protein [Deltaproteobacteria bacterium]
MNFMNAFIRFNRGILGLPLPWRSWLLLLVGANLVAPLFFLGHVEARIAIAALLLSLALMTGLTARWGFSRVLGLGHIVVWMPLLWFLSARLSDIPTVDSFGFWIRAVIALNAVSLVIDTIDLVRFLVGDRDETVVTNP